MIDQSTLQSNFLGRDGFYWWIGEVAPLEAQGEQVKNGGWGNRYKVRILGYHPEDTEELSDEDLPWAQVLVPTTAGSGLAHAAQSVQIKPQDRVFGFFLDGENGQYPVITNIFPAQEDSITTVVKQDRNPKLDSSQTNEPRRESQPTPASVDPKRAADEGKVSENEAIGATALLANTTTNTKLNKVKSTVNWLLEKLRRAKGEISKIRGYIRRGVDKIVTLMNEYVGGFFKEIIRILRFLLKKGLKGLGDFVYTTVLAATANPVSAEKAAEAAEFAMVPAVQELEKQFACVAGSVLDKIVKQVEDLIYSTLANVEKFVSCAGDQFLGSLLNTIIDTLDNLMTGPLALVEKILQFVEGGFDLKNIARSVVSGLASAAGAAFDCGQGTKNFSGLVNEWLIGIGPKAIGPDTYQSIQELTDLASSGVDFGDVTECFTGQPAATPPRIVIFGGGGTGATAVPVFGNVVPIEGESNCVALGSVIGAQITNGGSGYDYPPFVEVVDDANQGYGAIARALINDEGQVTAIYMSSEGEDYCVGDIADYSILDVIIEDSGDGYNNGDVVVDNLGNRYSTTVFNGQINSVTPLNNIVDSLPILTVESETGNGAILRPLLGTVNISGDVQQSIDCVK